MNKKQALIELTTKSALLQTGQSLGLDVRPQDRVDEIRETFLQARVSFNTILDSLSTPDLKKLCSKLGLSESGRPNTLRERLHSTPIKQWREAASMDNEGKRDTTRRQASSSSGSWGGGASATDNHESPGTKGRKSANRTSPARPPARALHEQEITVLTLAQLPWPVTLPQVRDARKLFASILHPDRHHGNNTVAAWMKLLNEGCDLLENRIQDS
jgi:hypothetical protein